MRSETDGYQRWVEVSASSRGTTSSWTVQQASALSGAVFEGGLLLVLRMADKRPWQFDPPRRLVWFSGTADPRTWELPTVERPWTPHDVRFDDDALLMATAHSLRDLQVAVDELRATSAEVSVTWPNAQMPMVSAAFAMPDGRRLRRMNQPFDVLGNGTGGLAGLPIWFEEDILGGPGLRPGAIDGDRI